MNQKQLAHRLGVTPQMISAWKLGKTGLSVRMALRWSKLLDLDFKALITAKTRRKREKLLGLEKEKGDYG